MSTPKGFPSQVKDARVGAQHVTVEPIGLSQYGLTMAGAGFNVVAATDSVEATSTASVIKATAHAVVRGDIIRFTSGTFNNREVRVHAVVDANNFELAETLSAAPSAGDTFQVLRAKAAVINADGTLLTSTSGDLSYKRDAVSTFVSEDTAVPANSRPLPVKLVGASGDLTITAAELNVRLDHSNDSVKIGDGTDLLAVNADGSINATITGEAATAADGGALPAVQKVIAGYDGAATQVIKTDASGELQVDVLTLPAVTAVNLDIRDLVFATDKVDASGSSVALDAPTLAALESITVQNGAGAAAVNVQDGGNSITVDGAVSVSATDLDVRDLTHVSDSVKVGDGTDFLAISAAGAASVSVVDPLPAGTNNIGDVDVLTMPGTFAEDSAHVSANTGVFVLGVRNDSGATLTSTDGDYSPVAVTAGGSVRCAVNFSAADGGALPTNQAVISGYDGAAVHAVKTDASGELQVDVLSVVPGTGATALGKAEDAAHGSGDVGVMALAVRSDAGGAFAADGDYVPLSINASGELRVTTAATATLDVIDFLDTPLLDASSTNIPASSGTPVTVVASLAAAVKKVQLLDTTGSFIGLYTDPAGTPVLQAVFGPGSDQILDVAISAASVIGLRNMENSAITAGLVSVNFIG